MLGIRLLLVVVLMLVRGYRCRGQDQSSSNESCGPSGVEQIDFPHPQIPSKFLARSELASPTLSVVEPKPIKPPTAPRTPFLLLGALVYTAAAYDMAETESEKQRWNRSVNRGLQTCPNCLSEGVFKWFSDNDPLARPIVNLPAPAYFATGVAIATGVNWLGWRMGRSRRFHRVWFIPQLISIGGNSWGGSSYLH